MTYDDGEAYATGAAPDPEQVAHRFHDERRALDAALVRWEQLTDDERAVAVAIVVAVLTWLRREGTLP